MHAFKLHNPHIIILLVLALSDQIEEINKTAIVSFILYFYFFKKINVKRIEMYAYCFIV